MNASGFVIAILALLFIATEWILAFGLPKDSKDIALIFGGLLGSILTMIGTIVNNIWGSSRGSQAKDETITKLLNENTSLRTGSQKRRRNDSGDLPAQSEKEKPSE